MWFLQLDNPPENKALAPLLNVAFPLLSATVIEVRDLEAAMQFLSNTVMIVTIALLSFEFSFLLSRGLLSLVLHSLQRLESRVKSH